MQTLKHDMEVYWPDFLKNGTRDNFWYSLVMYIVRSTGKYNRAHEWCKHGRCAYYNTKTHLQSEYSYFSATLNLIKTYNISKILLASNIVPRNDQPYKVQCHLL